MIAILNRYLIQHKSINIPGLGTLHLERVPAQQDTESGQILPPAYTLRFDKYFDAPGKAFFTYLAEQKKIPDYEAIKAYNQFAQDIRTAIKLEEKAVWKDMGTFRKDNSGDIIFEPDTTLLHPFAPVAAEKYISGKTVEPEAVPAMVEIAVATVPAQRVATAPEKNRWRIYALALGAIGLAVLFYQLYRYGYTWEAVANHQPLK